MKLRKQDGHVLNAAPRAQRIDAVPASPRCGPQIRDNGNKIVAAFRGEEASQESRCDPRVGGGFAAQNTRESLAYLRRTSGVRPVGQRGRGAPVGAFRVGLAAKSVQGYRFVEQRVYVPALEFSSTLESCEGCFVRAEFVGEKAAFVQEVVGVVLVLCVQGGQLLANRIDRHDPLGAAAEEIELPRVSFRALGDLGHVLHVLGHVGQAFVVTGVRSLLELVQKVVPDTIALLPRGVPTGEELQEVLHLPAHGT